MHLICANLLNFTKTRESGK